MGEAPMPSGDDLATCSTAPPPAPLARSLPRRGLDEHPVSGEAGAPSGPSGLTHPRRQLDLALAPQVHRVGVVQAALADGVEVGEDRVGRQTARAAADARPGRGCAAEEQRGEQRRAGHGW
jgi:hypothetical protein